MISESGVGENNGKKVAALLRRGIKLKDATY